MKRRKVKQRPKHVTIHIVPDGKGTTHAFRLRLYTTLWLLIGALFVFATALSTSLYLWDKQQKTETTLKKFQHYAVENEQLKDYLNQVYDDLTVFNQQIETLSHTLADITGMEETIKALDDELQNILPPAKSETASIHDTVQQTLITADNQLSFQPKPEEKSQVNIASLNSELEENKLYHPDSISVIIERLKLHTEYLKNIADEHESNLSVLKDDLHQELDKARYIPSIMPTNGRITSPFGWRNDPFTGQRRMHNGIDFANKLGTPIYATADGTVTFAGRNGGYGKQVRINHGNGYMTSYSHLHSIKVSQKEQVKKGDIIGEMGSTGRSTGVHLHYEIHLNGQPINPFPYIKGGE
ncbi:murein DD-endopeptidase MepM/ murein hydrolase activator NlpD [Caldalkalibacillus uzonensis]|uniref:Murein DD-endopeptidase MepM/ murein hydrolase activator NlpD n=1 Tax=Caldalkalibacillus uzonensis TaxID=353224 RepID=A0ABU0CSE8_9BACI|nr:M23 family metallopeptidase [Caldalkalibacillus uzonensis]MDQ0338806.1 murein DD-endopeptidase MepM/ murein hydrolase activator NlpD [Caldalkalibacillus uzonensis]